MVFFIIFWLSVFCIFHSYVFYPVLLRILSTFIRFQPSRYGPDDSLPTIAVLMAAYNEESVIKEKLQSIENQNYPKEYIKIYLGSDASTDQTDAIIREFSAQQDIYFKRFETRQGKPKIVNFLAGKAMEDILVITDANVIFDNQTLFELVKTFRDNRIGLVDTRMVNKRHKAEGISFQEKSYIAREVMVKYLESVTFGSMMGPFGGCFAVRNNLFEPIPSNYLVDDFYVNMKVFEKGKKAINSMHAKVYEEVSNNLGEEIRRKIRIAAGNFQNLVHFRHLLKKCNGVSFCFMSHKVFRWFGPVFILAALISNAFLLSGHVFYTITFLMQVLLLLIPFIDLILRKIHLHVILLRFITHFYSMNLALLIGLINYIRGVKTNVWQPTRRHQ